MTDTLSWVDEVFETPAIEDANGNVMPRRGTVQYTGLTVSDDEDNDRTVIAPFPTAQRPGVLPVALPDADTALSALQASYQGLRLSGILTAPRTLSYPAPTPDANGASGGVVSISNTTGEPLTIAVVGGTYSATLGVGLVGVFQVHTTGVRNATTNAETP